MGVPKSTGGPLNTKIIPNDNSHVEGAITTRDSFDKILSGEEYVNKTYFNAQAINADRFNGIIQKLKGYAEGSPINVTYLYHLEANSNDNTKTTDITTASNHIHRAFLKINNFEIRLKNQLNFSYDEDKTISNITGEAIIYPGFNPNISDIFIYRIDNVADGRTAVFKIIKAPTRLTFKVGTFREITFELLEFADNKRLNDIFKSVREVAWFEKKRFLSEDAALLKANEEFLIKDADTLISILSDYYYNEFFDNITMQTYVRPDGIYDPYIVDYIMSIFNFNPSHMTCMQLLPDYPQKEYSIWKKLLSPNKISWRLIIDSYMSQRHVVHFNEPSINTLINKEKLILTMFTKNGLKEGLKPYVNFYIGDDPNEVTTDLEKVIYLYLNKEVVIPDLLLKVCKDYFRFTYEDQFYIIPILVGILINVKESILKGRSNIKFDIESSIDDFKNKIYTPIILKETDTILTSNKTHETKIKMDISTILPNNDTVGTYIEILNPCKHKVELYSNEHVSSQRITDYNKISVISSYSKELLGTLHPNNSNVLLRLVDKVNRVYMIERSTGFEINDTPL